MKTRKGSNGGTVVRAYVILMVWRSGIAIPSKHRLNNSENVRSKLQPQNVKMCLQRLSMGWGMMKHEFEW